MCVPHREPVSRLDYCQYLLSSQINYTLTNFADHSGQFSPDQLNRFLRQEKLKPRLVWEQVKDSIIKSENGYLLFDDTVADKNYSFAIELVQRQYSGFCQINYQRHWDCYLSLFGRGNQSVLVD